MATLTCMPDTEMEREREQCSPACAVLKPNWTARVSVVSCRPRVLRVLRLLPQRHNTATVTVTVTGW